MKIQTTIYIHYAMWDWQEEGTFEAFTFKADDNEHRTFICEQEIEIEVPDNYDPRAQQIASLEKKRLKVMADYQKSVTEINERIGKLQAISFAE